MSGVEDALDVGTRLGQAVADVMEFGQKQGEKVTRARLKAQVMKLEPDEFGRISKGLVLAMIMGEVE
jgi:hypothetical protein